MKKKMLTLFLCAAIAAVSAMPVSADEVQPGPLARQIEAGLPYEELPYIPADPEDETDNIASFQVEYYYEGVAVTCRDIEKLKTEGLAGEPVAWSDGYWSSYWRVYGDPDVFLLQPLEGLERDFGDYMKYEQHIPNGAEDCVFHVPQEYADFDEPIYVLYAPDRGSTRRRRRKERQLPLHEESV